MNAGEVRKRVAKIHKMQGDPEVAHAEEDILWMDVLEQISQSQTCGWESELAREALRTRDIKFPRWYA